MYLSIYLSFYIDMYIRVHIQHIYLYTELGFGLGERLKARGIDGDGIVASLQVPALLHNYYDHTRNDNLY